MVVAAAVGTAVEPLFCCALVGCSTCVQKVVARDLWREPCMLG